MVNNMSHSSYRILYYNWDPYFQKPMQGGGVSIYCRNLIDYLTHQDNYQVSFLYSGMDYTFLSRHPYIKQVPNQTHPQVPTFSLFNSPIAAPSHLSFEDPVGNIQNHDLETCFQQFLAEQEPFGIIHFHNLEGLTANCLKLAKESGAKVVFSLHNYWAVCPQVNLWKLESSPCSNYFEGRACAACLPEKVNVDLQLNVRKLNHLGSVLGQDKQAPTLRIVRNLYKDFYLKIWNKFRSLTTSSPLTRQLELTGTELPQRAGLYRHRRQEIVSLINRYVDVALSVSERTTSIYRQYGVDPGRLTTQYIGSKATQFPVPTDNPKAYSPGQPFELIYMGPSRKDKGFYFFLEQLRSLPESELSNLDLVIASRITDEAELKLAFEYKGQFLSLAQSLHRLRFYPGYSYESIPTMLNGIHLGVIPPLWEDNLPQVTFELLACRVPVMCSNRGGAQEFVRHPAFIFDPAIEGDFQSKLRTIREHPQLLTEFWLKARQSVPIEQHFQDLVEIYNTDATRPHLLVGANQGSVVKTF